MSVKKGGKAKAKPTSKPKAKPVKPVKAAKPAKPVEKPSPKAAKKITPKAVPAKPVKAEPVKIEKKPLKESKLAKILKPSTLVKKEIPLPAAPVIPRRPALVENATLVPPDYDPKKDKGEFMNPVMSEYFRQKLLRWRSELLRESSETIHNTLQSTELQKPDLADRASAETDHALELRTRDRERKLISKINEALLRIEDGEYGYCEETGEPISVARLDARPNATLSLEAQERHERLERTQRDE